jgi:3-oxoacyl-[acyl-carrier-protein] synthase 3
MGIVFSGSGHALPKNICSNEDLSKIVDTSDEWISSRTGIKTRYIISDEESLTSLAIKAAKKTLESADTFVDVKDIGLIIVATSCADRCFPSCACEVQASLGAVNAMCFDLSAACSGFVYAVHTAECMMKSAGYKYALVIGGDILSRLIDWKDRRTCVLFGDGVGALLLNSDTSSTDSGILATDVGANGLGGKSLIRENFGDNRFIYMDGQDVFKFAVRTVPKSIENAVKKSGFSMNDISKFILHQANLRIIDSVSKRLNVPLEKFPINLDRVGNTSGGSVAILLDEELKSKQIQKGDLIVICGFGAGLTWASMVIRY